MDSYKEDKIYMFNFIHNFPINIWVTCVNLRKNTIFNNLINSCLLLLVTHTSMDYDPLQNVYIKKIISIHLFNNNNSK